MVFPSPISHLFFFKSIIQGFPSLELFKQKWDAGRSHLKGFLPQKEAAWVACGRRGPALKLKREVPVASGHKPLSELCLVSLESVGVAAVPGLRYPHTGAPGKDFLSL